mgnify:FL=1
MKFSWFDKLLLVVVLLLVIALAALCIGIAMSFVTADMAAHVTGIVTNGMTENRLIMGGIGLVLLILAFRLFIAMGNRKQEQPAAAPRATSALILSGDNGSAFITLAAVDSMVQRHCRANPKVKECESSVTAIENTAVAIALKLVVSNETVLPEFTKALQDSLKEYIEMYCGITVRDVDVLIVSTPAPAKQPRVM